MEKQAQTEIGAKRKSNTRVCDGKTPAERENVAEFKPLSLLL